MVVINHIILTIFSILIIPESKWICISAGFLIIVAGNTSFAAVNVIATQITTFVTRRMIFLVCSISFYASATVVTMVGADMLHLFGGFAFTPWTILFLFSVSMYLLCFYTYLFDSRFYLYGDVFLILTNKLLIRYKKLCRDNLFLDLQVIFRAFVAAMF